MASLTVTHLFTKYVLSGTNVTSRQSLASVAYWKRQVTSFDTHFIMEPGQRTEHVASFYAVVTHVLLSDWFILFPPVYFLPFLFLRPHPRFLFLILLLTLFLFPALLLLSSSSSCPPLIFVVCFLFLFRLPQLHLNLTISAAYPPFFFAFAFPFLFFFPPSNSSFYFSSIIFSHVPTFQSCSCFDFPEISGREGDK